MIIDRSKYKESNPKQYLRFKHPGHENIIPALAGRLAYLCQVKGKIMNISRGYVSSAEQQAVGDALLKANPTYYRRNGAVYNQAGQCMAAAPGNSNHEFRQAVDSGDTWAKALTNAELAAYGLYKPMDYEPWHIQCIETKGVSKDELKNYDYGGDDDMDVKGFQAKMGLVVDGIAGPKTKAAAQEVLPVVLQILGLQDPQKLQAQINQMTSDIKAAKNALSKY